MKYGFCTGFATEMKDDIDYALVRRVKAAGYDYAEFPLMQVAALSDSAFETLASELERLDLACTATCNLFPASIQVVGPQADRARTEAYLQHAWARAARLGMRKIIFGSSPSRQLPVGWTKEQGHRQIVQLIHESMLPLCERYDFQLVMEPIASQYCNLINSLSDGMRVVDMANSPRVSLLADSVHMLSDHEDPAFIVKYADALDHIHVSEMERALPEESYTPELERILQTIKDIGYDKTISFEPMPSEHIDRALHLLKSFFSARP